MNIDETIDFATLISLCICVFGWVLILITIPIVFINSSMAVMTFIAGMIIMVVGALLCFTIEPIFRLVYRYLLKKD